MKKNKKKEILDKLIQKGFVKNPKTIISIDDKLEKLVIEKDKKINEKLKNIKKSTTFYAYNLDFRRLINSIINNF